MSRYLQSRLIEARNRFLVVGGMALLLCLIGAFFEAKEFFVSYWFSYLFWLGLALGCLVITMIHHLTGGRWGHPARRFTEAGLSTLPLMALLFIPVFFGLRYLYPWANRSGIWEGASQKQLYLSPGFYIVRVIFYFAVWLLLARLLRHWSLAQDETSNPEPTRRLLRLSGPGVVILPITATFAYVDWIMSMEDKWYSTIFAIVILAGQLLAAYAFTVVLLKLFERQDPLSRTIRQIHFHQLGNLMLTFVLFWTYVAFGQLLIIYSTNLPEEISWYLHRIAGGCKYVVGAIALFHFFLPFFVLLFRRAKQSSASLAIIAVVLLVIHLAYTHWLITPSVFTDGLHVTWLDFVAPIGIGGIWVAVFLSALGKAPLIPLNDPRINEELATLESSVI